MHHHIASVVLLSNIEIQSTLVIFVEDDNKSLVVFDSHMKGSLLLPNKGGNSPNNFISNETREADCLPLILPGGPMNHAANFFFCVWE
jgi:hypothetical protein